MQLILVHLTTLHYKRHIFQTGDVGQGIGFYGNQIGVKYGEPFVVKEAMQVDDIVAMPVRSI